MHARLVAILAVALSLIGLLSLPARAADGQIATVATFTSGGEKLSIDTYTDSTTTVGMIAIVTASNKTFSYAFDNSDLKQLMPLWDKAEAIPDGPYSIGGSLAETGTTNQDVLLLAGGPALRFSIADPIDGLAVFVLARTQYAAFDAALHKAATATAP